VKEFSLERVTPSPAVFDMEKLYWLNRHSIKQASSERIDRLALPYYTRALSNEMASAGRAGADMAKDSGGLTIDAYPWSPDVIDWFSSVTRLLVPSVDRLDQLPDRASFIFHYDAPAALAAPANRETLAWPNTDAVITRFTVKILEDESARSAQLTAECFKHLVNEVKAETGAKGKELFHPIRLVVTGSHSGPEFDKLIPILEEGSRLALPKHVLNTWERVQAFAKAKGK
jgi:nondiscriminating glutamyl-tRNA synthetase